MAPASTLSSVLGNLSPNPPTALLELAKRLQEITLSEQDAIKVYLFIKKLDEKYNLDVDFPDDEDDVQERLNNLRDSIEDDRSRLLDAAASSEVDNLVSEYESNSKSPQDFGFARLTKQRKKRFTVT